VLYYGAATTAQKQDCVAYATHIRVHTPHNVTAVVGGDTGRTLCTCAEGCVRRFGVILKCQCVLRFLKIELLTRGVTQDAQDCHGVRNVLFQLQRFSCGGWHGSCASGVSLDHTSCRVGRGRERSGKEFAILNLEAMHEQLQVALPLSSHAGFRVRREPHAQKPIIHTYTHAHARALTSSEMRSY
jgi:hypothetical protein